MVRIQEHYESPEFSGKVFTLDEFRTWYTANSARGRATGEFTYYTDWNGGNFPGSNLEAFFSGEFDPLSDDEHDILKCAIAPDDYRHCYFILTHKGRPDAVRHEIAHALYYTNYKYKNEVNKLMNWHAVASNRLKDKLMDMGYGTPVLRDEIQAHLVHGWDRLVWNCDCAAADVKAVFDRYCKGGGV